MRKIFYYQCRRLLCNKLFWGLLAVILWYSRRCCTAKPSGECAHTGPFPPGALGITLRIPSPLPLCSGTVLPLLLSPHLPSGEAGVEVLASATPCLPQALFLLPMGALAGGTGVLTLLILFRWPEPLPRPDVPLGQLWGTPRPSGFCPSAPALLFFLGAGWFLETFATVLLYPPYRLAFLMCLSPAAPLARPSRGALFLTYPLELGVLDPRLLPPAGCRVAAGAGV